MKKFLIFFLPCILFAQVIDTIIRFPDDPWQLLYISEGNELYINFGRRNYLSVLDCSNYNVKKIITLPADYMSRAYGVWNWRRDKIYYTFGNCPDSIAVIYNPTDSIIKWINYEAYWPPCYNSIDDKIYAVAGNSLAVINCETDSIIKIIHQSYDLSSFVVWDSIGNKVYCGSGWACDEVAVINCENDSVIAVINTELSTPYMAVFNPQARKVYVGSFWGRGVAAIDAIGDTLIKYFPARFNQDDLPFVYNGLEDKIYFYSELDTADLLRIIDCQTDSIIKEIRSGWIHCIDFVSWSNRLYFVSLFYDSNGPYNLLSVLNCQNDSVISQIRFGRIATSIAHNPQNHLIYVADMWDSALYVIRDEIPGVEECRTLDAKRLMSEIYSNPVKSVLRICVPFSVKEIKIFNVTGKLIKEIASSSVRNDEAVEISLKGINPGIYFLQLGKEVKKFLVVK